MDENNSAGNGSIISKTFVQRIGSTRKQGHAPAAFAALLRLLHCYVMHQPSDVHQTRLNQVKNRRLYLLTHFFEENQKTDDVLKCSQPKSVHSSMKHNEKLGQVSDGDVEKKLSDESKRPI